MKNGTPMEHFKCPVSTYLVEQKSGNTKQISRINPSKKWCFTFNNYNDNSMEQISSICYKNNWFDATEV